MLRDNSLAKKRKIPVWNGEIFEQRYRVIQGFLKRNGIRLLITACTMLGLWSCWPKKHKRNSKRSAFRLKILLAARLCPFAYSKKRWISVPFHASTTKWLESHSGAE